MGYLIHDLKWYLPHRADRRRSADDHPGTVSDIAGFAVLAAIFVLQTIENKKEKKAASV